MKKSLWIISLLLLSLVAVSQLAAQSYSVRGIVKSSHTGEELGDALITLTPGDYRTNSYIGGDYLFSSVKAGKYTLLVKLIGFEEYSTTIDVDKNLTVDVNLISSGYTTDVIEVNRAYDRKTPVSFSDVDQKTLKERQNGQDAPMLLRNIPGFYSFSSDGVGNGEARLLVRGFNQNYVQVLINGIPTNDPESNSVYWSNWGSVSSNANSIQIQRGAGSSLYGSGAFGGSFNVLTELPSLTPRFRFNGSLGDPKNSLLGGSFSSGLLGGKFAANLNIDRKIAEGSRTSGRYEGLNYYTSIAFFPTANQSLNLVLHGAPQEHGYSYSSHISYFKLFGLKANSAYFLPADVVNQLPNNANTGAPNFGLNSHSRILDDPKYVNLSHNFFHKPQTELHYTNTFGDNSVLKTTLFYSLGRGGGSSLSGTGTLYNMKKGLGIGGVSIDTLLTNLYGPGGFVNTVGIADTVFLKNAVQRISYSLHRQFGVLASYSKDFGKNLKVTGGAEFRSWYADHPGHYTNLFKKTSSTQTYGARDLNNALVTFSRKIYQGDLDGPESDIGNIFGWNLAGDKDPTYRTQYRNYVGEVPQLTVFAQANYEVPKTGLNLMGSLQYVWYKYKLTENMPSENAIGRQLSPSEVTQLGVSSEGPRGEKFYMQGTNSNWYEFNLINTERSRGFLQPKFGFNYNFNPFFNVFGNYAHVERFVDLGVYYNQGAINPDAEDEKSNQFELGFGYANNFVSAKINGYYMLWDNKSARIRDITQAGINGYDRDGYKSLLVGTSEHKGIEFEATMSFDRFLPVKGFGFRTSFTFMDNKWKSVLDAVKLDQAGNRTVFNSAAIDENGNTYTLYTDMLEGTPVASGPQIMSSYSITYDQYGFFGSLDATWFAKDIMFDGGSYLAVKGDFLGYTNSGGKLLFRSEYGDRLPARIIFDFNVGYSFNIYQQLRGTVSFQVLNVFDTEYYSSSDRFGVIPGYGRALRGNVSIGL